MLKLVVNNTEPKEDKKTITPEEQKRSREEERKANNRQVKRSYQLGKK